jgi:hypothetical protein
VIDQLNTEFKKSGPKDKQAIVKGIAKCFEEKRLEPKEGQPADNQLNIAAAAALGQMGPESTDSLINWIGHKDLRKDIVVQHRLILSLGQTKDKKGIKTLGLTLENKTPSVVAAAAEALGEFKDSDLATRKDIFENLLKILMSSKNAKDGNINDTIARSATTSSPRRSSRASGSSRSTTSAIPTSGKPGGTRTRRATGTLSSSRLPARPAAFACATLGRDDPRRGGPSVDGGGDGRGDGEPGVADPSAPLRAELERSRAHRRARGRAARHDGEPDRARGGARPPVEAPDRAAHPR